MTARDSIELLTLRPPRGSATAPAQVAPMRPRPAFYVVLVLVVAGTSALLRRHSEVRVSPGALVPVVVAAEDLSPGTVLTYDHLQQRSFPEQWVFEANVRADSAASLIGKHLRTALTVGEPIRWADVAERDPLPQ